MDSPLISIIVPIYNVAEYLDECLTTLIRQKYKNIEIILVDDGSTDNSLDICEKYKDIDERIKCYHKDNGGLSDARNYGLSKATGEYLAFVDSDDWISESMYSEMLEAALSYDADIVCCGLYRVYKNVIKEETASKCGVYNADVALRLLLNNKEIKDHACTKLIKSKLFKGIEFPVGKIYEDIRTIYKLYLSANKVAVINKPLYYYRQRKSSIARGLSVDKANQYIEAINEIACCKEIAKNQTLVDILRYRISVVSCYLYKDVVINRERIGLEDEKLCRNLEQNIKANTLRMLLLERRSCKIIALLACLGLGTSRRVLRTPWLIDTIESKYSYYQ